MSEQSTALRLAEALCNFAADTSLSDRYCEVMYEAADELRRLDKQELASNIWLEKTEWVQETAQPQELGMHRADVLRQRIERLSALNGELLEALKALCESHSRFSGGVWDKARDAIAKAEGQA
jgi:hypothetical protein